MAAVRVCTRHRGWRGVGVVLASCDSREAIAAGALLAVISISIVPYAFAEVSSLMATATVLGFAGGYPLS